MSTHRASHVYLISGAGRGLAHGVAAMLLESGHRVHGIARSQGGLRAIEQRLGPGRAHGGDLTEAGVAQGIVQQVLQVEGDLHGVVLGVGDYRTGSLESTDSADWQSLWSSNVLCGVHLFDASRTALRASGGSALFFGAAGLSGLRARRTTAAYTATKTALLSYMRSLAKEEAPHGVRVNMVSPGIVPHPGASEDTRDPAAWQQIPQGRPGSVRDVAQAALWLLGPEATHVTGQNLEVAGGFLL